MGSKLRLAVSMSVFLAMAVAYASAPATPKVSVDWYLVESGLNRQIYNVSIRNMEPEMLNHLNLSLVFADTSFPSDALKNAKVYALGPVVRTHTEQAYSEVFHGYNATGEKPWAGCTEEKDASGFTCMEASGSKIVEATETDWILLEPKWSAKTTARAMKKSYDDIALKAASDEVVWLRVEFSTPLGATASGWGSTGMVGVVDEDTGALFHPWWNASFARRNCATYNYSNSTITPAVNYSIPINLTYDADMYANFSDVRVAGNKSADAAEISYWIEDKVDSRWAYVWVNTSLNATLCFYYGNPALHINASNGTFVFPLFDDFNRPDTTSDTLGHNWSITNAHADDITRIVNGRLSLFDNNGGVGSESVSNTFTANNITSVRYNGSVLFANIWTPQYFVEDSTVTGKGEYCRYNVDGNMYCAILAETAANQTGRNDTFEVRLNGTKNYFSLKKNYTYDLFNEVPFNINLSTTLSTVRFAYPGSHTSNVTINWVAAYRWIKPDPLVTLLGEESAVSPTEPMVSIISDINGTNGTTYSYNGLSATFYAHDINAGDTITMYVNVTRNGTVTYQNSSVVANGTNVIYYNGSLSKNYTYSFSVLAGDGTANSTTNVTGSRYVINYVPTEYTAGSVNGTNGSTFANNSLAYQNYQLNDRDANETLWAQFYVTRNTTDIIPASYAQVTNGTPTTTVYVNPLLLKNYDYRMSHMYNDSQVNYTASPVFHTSTYISNYRPHVSGAVSISPAGTASPTANLQCNYTPYDIDSGETLKAHISWYLNGGNSTGNYTTNSSVSNGTGAVETLSYTNTTRGETWSCNVSITDSDGAILASVGSSNVTISNILPTAPTQNSPANNTNLTVEYSLLNCSGSTDADGDPIYYLFWTSSDGAAFTLGQNTTGTTYNWTTMTLSPHTYFWRCAASDWMNSSTSANTTTRYLNTVAYYLNLSVLSEANPAVQVKTWKAAFANETNTYTYGIYHYYTSDAAVAGGNPDISEMRNPAYAFDSGWDNYAEFWQENTTDIAGAFSHELFGNVYMPTNHSSGVAGLCMKWNLSSIKNDTPPTESYVLNSLNLYVKNQNTGLWETLVADEWNASKWSMSSPALNCSILDNTDGKYGEYAEVKIGVTLRKDAGWGVNTSMKIYEVYTYRQNNDSSMSLTPAMQPRGNNVITVSDPSGTYGQRTYYLNLPVAANSTLTAYLPSGTIATAQFFVTDINGGGIPAVLVYAEHSINGSWVNVSNGITDASGLTTMYLTQGDAYRMWSLKDGALISHGAITASTQVYQLVRNTTFTMNMTSILEGIYMAVSPNNITMANGTAAYFVNFTFNITAWNSSLSSYGIMVICNDTNTLYNANSTGSGGGIKYYRVDVANCTNMTLEYHFNRTLGGYYTNRVWYNVQRTHAPGLLGGMATVASAFGASNMMYLAVIILAITAAGLSLVNPGAAAGGTVIIGGILTYAGWLPWGIYLLTTIAVFALWFLRRNL